MPLNPQSSTWQRAHQALVCSPFKLELFTAMRLGSVPLPAIAAEAGKNQGYCDRLLSENRVERELNWLTQVGLLRREVDGQGITDSFRLTPLGRQVLEKCLTTPTQAKPPAQAYINNTFERLRHFSI